MKLKKMSISAGFILTALSLCISPAIAAEYDCRQCTIVLLGMVPNASDDSTDGFMVRVVDAKKEWGSKARSFFLDDSLGKAGWATVLTAYSMGKTLRLQLVDTAKGSLIYGVFIND